MSNKKILFFIFGLVIVVLSGCSISNNNTVPVNSCADCGQGGWQKMEKSCDQEILNKNDFKKCLMKFSWPSVSDEMSIEEIEEGYIEMGSMKILNNPTTDSIKVYIYHQWSVDKDGNLYLLGQLG